MAQFSTHMEEEIFSQPEAIRMTLRGRIDFAQAMPVFQEIEAAVSTSFPKRIILVACGSSWNACLVAEYFIEQLAQIPVEVAYASEFRYRPLLIDDDTLVIALSQSGETEDTVQSARLVKNAGKPIWGICNVQKSTLTYLTDVSIFLHAGEEYGLASTKAFTCQLAVLMLLAIYFGRKRDLSAERGLELLRALELIPQTMQAVLHETTIGKIRQIATELLRVRNFLFLGRGVHFPIALEGALKFKEVAFIHAEGYPAAEMKHGAIALIDANMCSLFIKFRGDPLSEKILSNMQEVKAREGSIIVVGDENDADLTGLVEHILPMPESVLVDVSPLITVIPLQLLAYEIAVQKKLNVDRIRSTE